MATKAYRVDGDGKAVSYAALPLYTSVVAAGFPAPGDDLVEASLQLQDYLVSRPESTFFVRVEGDSMEGAKIFSGDILVVDRSVEVYQGAIVVAVFDGGMVVKRVKLRSDSAAGVWLVSENPAYAPIPVLPESDCYVWGVVTGSVRRF